MERSVHKLLTSSLVAASIRTSVMYPSWSYAFPIFTRITVFGTGFSSALFQYNRMCTLLLEGVAPQTAITSAYPPSCDDCKYNLSLLSKISGLQPLVPQTFWKITLDLTDRSEGQWDPI